MRILKRIQYATLSFKFIKRWKNSVDKGKSFGALLTDLSKAFACLDNELPTAELNAYGITLPALRLIQQRLMIIIALS